MNMDRDWAELRYAHIVSLPWSEYDEIQKEAKRIHKVHITTADIINDALTRYKKKKVNARNKKEAEDMKLRFKDIEPYESERDLQDAYGYGCISKKEYDRLLQLFQCRAEVLDANGNFSDDVTALLERALENAYGENADFLAVAGRMEYESNKQKKTHFQRGV